MTNLDWDWLLDPANGGPGDSPGREEAVRLAKADTDARYAAHGRKRAKGSNARKPKIESRQATDARKARYSSLKHTNPDP